MQDCLKKQIFISNTAEAWKKLYLQQIWAYLKLNSLFQVIFEPTDFWRTTEFDIFQKTLFQFSFKFLFLKAFRIIVRHFLLGGFT